MKEIWKDIQGFEWYYQVSNTWKVKKLDRYEEIVSKKWTKWKRFRKWWEVYITKSKRKYNTYLWACLWKNWKVKFQWMHRLIAIHFIPNPENKPEVNHIDWNSMNNDISNLEWCTRSENELHKYRVLWREPWNKWKKLSETRPEIYEKVWETRKNNIK